MVGWRRPRWTLPHDVFIKGDFELPIILFWDCIGAVLLIGKIHEVPRFKLARSGNAYCGRRFPSENASNGLICVRPSLKWPLHPTSFIPISMRNNWPGSKKLLNLMNHVVLAMKMTN